MAVAEHRFRAMGSACHVIVVGGRDPWRAAFAAERLVADLEVRWSRFRDDSEISRLNAASGQPQIVSAETYDVVARAVAAWTTTSGLFDPTVEPSLVAMGYDRTFDKVRTAAPGSVTATRPVIAPGCGGIVLDAVNRVIQLPPGTRLDLGAIGKGRAADIVAERLDADGVCINLGGDLRVHGVSPSGDDWPIGVESPSAAPDITLSLASGGIATSNPRARSWRTGRGPMSHVINPVTGRPVATPVAAATVVAGETWWAEVLATYAVVAPPASALRDIPSLGGEVLLYLSGGGVLSSDGLAAYLGVPS